MKRALEAWFKTSIVLCAGWLAGCDADSAATRFTRAQHWEEATRFDAAQIHARYEMPAAVAWHEVALPDVQLRQRLWLPNPNDEPTTWVTHWYRLHWIGEVVDGDALAVYIPRIHPLNGHWAVYVDGERHLPAAGSGWNDPVLLPVAVQRDANRIAQVDVLIGVSFLGEGGAALSSVWIGPQSALQWRYTLRKFFQLDMVPIVAGAFVAAGVFSFLFWLRRRQEWAYLLFALASLVNFARAPRYFFTDVTQLSPWFAWAMSNASGLLLVLTHLFAFSLHRVRNRHFDTVLIAVMVLTAVLSLLLPLLDLMPRAVVSAIALVQMAAAFAVTGLIIKRAVQLRTLELGLLAASQTIWCALLIHDVLLSIWRVHLESIYLSPYGALCLLGVFLFVVLRRYVFAIHEADELKHSLEQRVQVQARALKESHDKLRVIERQQTIADERQRLMREMHDGLGSSLMSSLAMVEQGDLDKKAVANVLRESIDDLKLTIDSLEPTDDDLLALLATLRYRIGKRLELAGLKLIWKVRETPPLLWLNPTTALQVLRILQETLTNVLKHAQATEIRVETDFDDHSVFVRLTDNGKGFEVSADPSQQGGRGLLNMRRRAAALGGRVEFTSQSGQTTVTLALPLHQSQ